MVLMHFISFSRTLLWSMPAQEWAQNLWKFTHRITGSPFSSSLLFRIFPYPPTSVLWPPENSFSWFFWPESWISLRVSATHVLHCCAALQVGPTLGQSHEIRGENGERPYMTFRSFDSPSQSACFCLLCGVLRYLLFVFTFLVVISKRDGPEWFYSTFANIRDPLPTSNFILHHCPVTLL